MQFSCSLPSWVSFDERVVRRDQIDLQATITDRKFGVLDAKVTDISGLGCRSEISQAIAIGTSVTIGLTASVALKGWIAWAADGAVGIEFAQPVPDAVIASMLGRSPRPN